MKLFFVLLAPLFLFAADIKFSSAASLDEASKNFAKRAASAIEEELGTTLIKNFESQIYEDEAALYALKSGIIKFGVVKKSIFADLGLDIDNTHAYGLEIVSHSGDALLLTQSRFFAGIDNAKKTKLKKRLKSNIEN